MTYKECISCGAKLKKIRQGVKYCNSHKCQKAREKAWKEQKEGRTIEKTKVEIKCPYCNRLFMRNSHNQKMCSSRECYIAKRKADRVKYEEKNKQYTKQYYHANKEIMQQKYKEWKAKHPHYRPPSYYKSSEYYNKRKDTKSYQEYCKAYRDNKKEINKRLKAISEDKEIYYTLWDEQEDMLMIEMRESGASWEEVGEALSRTLFAVMPRYYYLVG